MITAGNMKMITAGNMKKRMALVAASLVCLPTVAVAASSSDGNSGGAWMIVLAIILGIYFAPFLVANRRAHHNQLAIFMLNLLLGWTLLGWIIAMVWACTQIRPQQRAAGPQPVATTSSQALRADAPWGPSRKDWVTVLSVCTAVGVVGLIFKVAGLLPEAAPIRQSGSGESIKSEGRSLSFEQCSLTIDRTARQLGVTPITIVTTDVMRMVRFCTTEGSVLVTCQPTGWEDRDDAEPSRARVQLIT